MNASCPCDDPVLLPALLPNLVSKLTDGDSETRLEALATLRNLSYDALNKKSISDANVLKLIVSIAKEEKGECLVKALGLLLTLAISDDIKRFFALPEIGLLTVLEGVVLQEDQLQFDDEIKSISEQLEALWNTTPTTHEIQRGIGYLRKDLKVLRIKKAFMQEARNYCLAILLKLSSLPSNIKGMCSAPSSVLPGGALLAALSKVVSLDTGETRLKALKIILHFSLDDDVRSHMHMSRAVLCSINNAMKADEGEGRLLGLQIILNMCSDNLEKRRALCSITDDFKLFETLMHVLGELVSQLSLNLLELATATDRITIIEVCIMGLRAKLVILLMILHAVVLVPEHILDLSNYDLSLYQSLCAVVLEDRAQARILGLDLLVIFSSAASLEKHTSDSTAKLLTCLTSTLLKDEDIPEVRNKCFALLQGIDIDVLKPSSQLTEFVAYLMVLLSRNKDLSSSLRLLLRIFQQEESAKTLIDNELGLLPLLDSIRAKEELAEELYQQLVLLLSQKETNARLALKACAPTAGKKKLSCKRNNRIILNQPVSTENLSDITPSFLDPTSCNSATPALSISDNTQLRTDIAISESEDAEELCQDEEDSEPQEEEDDTFGGDEIRPSAPTSSVPSFLSSRPKSFIESGLSGWQYLGYWGKK